MRINQLMSGIAICVLSGGLASCSPENKPKDVYQAAPPAIVQSDRRLSLPEFDRAADRTLALDDLVDVTAAGARIVRVQSQCLQGARSFAGDQILPPDGAFPLFRLMPIESLFVAAGELNCSFTMTLTNDVGSNHVYAISNVRLKEIAKNALALEENNDAKILNAPVAPAELRATKARLAHKFAARATLECLDFTLPDLSFDQVVRFEDFAFQNTQARPGRGIDVALEKPRQNCRVLVREGAAIRAVSSLVNLNFPRPLIAALVTPVRGPVPAFIAGAPLTLANLQIHNSSPTAIRRLWIPKAAASVLIDLFQYDFHLSKFQYRQDALRLALLSANAVSETADGWRLDLAPGADLLLQARLEAPRPYSCGHEQPLMKGSGAVTNVLVESAALPLFEVDADGSNPTPALAPLTNILNFTDPLPDPAMLNMPRTTPSCDW